MLEPIINRARDNKFLWNAVRIVRERFRPKTLEQWEKRGKPLPAPHFVKSKVVIDFMAAYNLKTFIETGTHHGDMVAAMKDHVDTIHSIEIDPGFHEGCKKRFEGEDHIHLHLGDSGDIFPEILKDMTEPCLFWLDAHYSGGSSTGADLETPIIQEIKPLLAHSVEGHVILVDDARLFIGKNDYPTEEGFKKMVLEEKPGWTFENDLDIIRIYEKKD